MRGNCLSLNPLKALSGVFGRNKGDKLHALSAIPYFMRDVSITSNPQPRTLFIGLQSKSLVE